MTDRIPIPGQTHFEPLKLSCGCEFVIMTHLGIEISEPVIRVVRFGTGCEKIHKIADNGMWLE